MLRWQWKGILFLLLWGLSLPFGGEARSADAWQQMKQREQRLREEGAALQAQRQHLRGEVKAIATQLQRLKEEATRGIFGLPARMRLSSVRAEAQRRGQRLEEIEAKLQAHTTKEAALRASMLQIVRKRLMALQARWNQASDEAQRQPIREAILRWSGYARTLVVSGEKKTIRPLKEHRVALEPLDGPQEIRQKVDLLRDSEDRIRRRMALLQKKLNQLKIQIARSRQDQRLAQRVSEMMQEDELFNETERSPRVAGTRERNTAPANASAGKNGSDTSFATAQKGGTQSSPQAPPRGTESVPSSDPQAGSLSPPSVDGPSRVGMGSAQVLRPQVGVLPSERVEGRNQDPLNPKGSLEEQMRSLQRYQKQLQEKAATIQKQKQAFLRRATEIESEERKRLQKRAKQP